MGSLISTVQFSKTNVLCLSAFRCQQKLFYHTVFSLSRTFFKKFFSRFFQIFYITFQFLAALACCCLAATFSIILSFSSLSRTFFNFFSSLFHFIFMFSTYSLSSPPPCDDLYYYTLSSPFVNTFFEKNFNFFEKLKKSPNFRAFSHFYHLYVMLFFFLFIISYICHSLFRYSETNF